MENLRLDFALENLFDRKYQPAFSLMEGTGRNAKISAVYSFKFTLENALKLFSLNFGNFIN